MSVRCADARDGFLCDRDKGHVGNHRGYNSERDAPMFWAAHSPGAWTVYSMASLDRAGDGLTPEEIGEYVTNSVKKSAEESGSLAFLFVSVETPDGPRDVCHVGNGPTSPANACLIAAAPVMLAALKNLTEALNDDLTHEQAEAWDDAMDAIAKAEGTK